MTLKVLSDADVQRIHDASLSVLEKTGVYFHPGAESLDIFAENGCLVDGRRVFIPGAVAEKFLKVLPDRDGLRYFLFPYSKNEITLRRGESHLALIGNIYYAHDYHADAVRPATNADFEDKDTVFNGLGSFEVNLSNVFVLPGHEKNSEPFYDGLDDPAGMVRFLESRVYRRGFRNSDWVPHVMLRPEGFSRLELLAYAILEGPGKLRERCAKSHPFVWVNPISPLQYHGEQTDMVIRESGKVGAIIQISPECMMGTSSPVTLAGTLVQHNAEVLGMAILAQIVRPGTGCVYGCVSCVTDLRNADVSHGSFETQQLNVAAVQMADFYGMPSRISPGNTNARTPSPRAAAETALGLYMGMAAGGNIITTGLLNSTLTLSLEHMVLVDEWFKQYKGNCAGIEVTEERLALDQIDRYGRPSSGYVSSDFTLDQMKKDVYYSGFTGRTESSYEDSYRHANRKVGEMMEARKGLEPEASERFKCAVRKLKENPGAIKNGEGEWWLSYFEKP